MTWTARESHYSLHRRFARQSGEFAISPCPRECPGLRLGDRAPAGRPYLALNMVSTLDGKATIEWRTKGLSTELDRRLFHHLRTQVDAVMIGAGTARVERYGRIAKSEELRAKRVSEGLAPEPLAIIASRFVSAARRDAALVRAPRYVPRSTSSS